MTFLEYLNAKQSQTSDEIVLTESFKNSDVEQAHKLMLNLFQKKIGGKISMNPSVFDTKVNGKNCKSVMFVHTPDDKKMDIFILNYLISSKSSEVYSIDFFNEKSTSEILFGSGKAKSTLSIATQGTSIAYFIPVICHVVSAKDYNLDMTNAKKIGKTIFGESVNQKDFWLGAVKYNVIEGLSDQINEDAFNLSVGNKYIIAESGKGVWEAREKTELTDARKAKGHEINAARAEGNKELAKRLQKEYNAIVDAIHGGAKTFADMKEMNLSINKNVEVEIVQDKQEKNIEKDFNKKATKDPKEAFKEMYGYLSLVTKGLQPGAIICGAPGIGKTYKCLQYLKSKGYENGENMHIIKGKCSTRSLWADLYNFREKGQILFLDDADGLIGKNAPEECINILKAALDSTSAPEGRLVSYRIAGRLVDEDGIDIPKEFYYNGSIIVLTNYSIGQLDTALRGRVFTQTLDFSTEQLLQIIEDLLPSIEPQKLSNEAKLKSLLYLKKLNNNGTNVIISIRSFVTCAGLYEMGLRSDGEFSDSVIESMILEQMSNQALVAGKHF
jgi:hypothetical protein